MPTGALVDFVRGTLGCRCPDEVFRSVAVTAAETPDGARQFTRVVIGDRLLVYVLSPQPPAALGDAVLALARQGRSERDGRGYNRFRLVVEDSDVERAAAAAAAAFDHAVGRDTRAHLHVVREGDVPGFHDSK